MEVAGTFAAAPQSGLPWPRFPSSTCYRHWLAALERLVADKELLARADFAVRKATWEKAFRETPHGKPVVLPSDSETG